MSFKEKKYSVMKQVISPELANFAFNYFLLKREAVDWMMKSNYISKVTPGFGTWEDDQVWGTFSCYADIFMKL